MKQLGMSTLNQSEIEVWSRTERRVVSMASHVAAKAVAAGFADLMGPGALPIDTTLPAGGRTAGLGDGHVLVRLVVGGERVERLPLLVAQRVVVNGLAFYVNADGSPLMEPSVETEPSLAAEEPRAEEPTKKTAAPVSKLRRLAGRLASVVA